MLLCCILCAAFLVTQPTANLPLSLLQLCSVTVPVTDPGIH